jgi:phosphoribosylanthranilate isomerase
MLVKVCGLTNRSPIAAIEELAQIDFVGFILVRESPRFIDDFGTIPPKSTPSTHRVGVFKNPTFDEVRAAVDALQLDFIQLHGKESPEFCSELVEIRPVIKAIGIASPNDLELCNRYQHSCAFLILDTKSDLGGGSGKKFDWTILEKYTACIPFLLSGGIAPEDADFLANFQHEKCIGIDINSRFETAPGAKDLQKIKSFTQKLHIMNNNCEPRTPNCEPQTSNFEPQTSNHELRTMNFELRSPIPDSDGFYGDFGGAFIPELLRPNVEELKNAFYHYRNDPEFLQEFHQLLRDYVGRPTPLYLSTYLSKRYNARVYLKREDLNHTGAHKINNTIGQILLAKRMGKQHIIAETGAGQHGVATATACALLGLKCTVFMGEKDIERQAPNVQRMYYLGAEVIPATSGSKTLKDATNEAIRFWINNPETFYLIGSVVGPHPYPEMVAYFQAVISEEIEQQLLQKEGKSDPDTVIACVGGGSNAAGAFYTFYEKPHVRLVAAEAAGEGVNSGKSAATSVLGTPGIIHGSYTLLMQDSDGQITEPHSISAGLDYPGIGPLHAHTIATGRVAVVPVTDTAALQAASELARFEGIIPALETAHALSALEQLELQPGEIVVINLSGRGDKDLATLTSNIEPRTSNIKLII